MASSVCSPGGSSPRRRHTLHSSVDQSLNSNNLTVATTHVENLSNDFGITSIDNRPSTVIPHGTSFKSQVAFQGSQMPSLDSEISSPESEAESGDAQISALEFNVAPLGSQSHASDATIGSAYASQREDTFGKFPAEIRVMIYKELLVAHSPIFIGVEEFGKLREAEFNPESKVVLALGILQTCRRYYHEAISILYTQNRMNFCTGVNGSSGCFSRFPISRRYMHFLTEIGIYFRVTTQEALAISGVAHFLGALDRRAPNLRHLLVCAASDRYYEAACPVDVIFWGNPIVTAILDIIARGNVQHIKLRLHDDAAFAPNVADFIQSYFETHQPKPGATLTFSRSCSCPEGCPIHAKDGCQICGRPRESSNVEDWPIEDIILSPDWCEPSSERMQELVDEILDQEDDNADHDDADEDSDGGDEADYDISLDFHRVVMYAVAMQGIRPLKREKSTGKGLTAHPLLEMRCEHCDSHGPEEHPQPRYRGKMTVPAAWLMRQSKITDFFKTITYEKYFETLFPSSRNTIPSTMVHGIGHLLHLSHARIFSER